MVAVAALVLDARHQRGRTRDSRAMLMQQLEQYLPARPGPTAAGGGCQRLVEMRDTLVQLQQLEQEQKAGQMQQKLAGLAKNEQALERVAP